VGAKKFDHVTCLYKKLNILKFLDLCKLEVAKAMHHFNKSKLPPTFNNFFVRALDVY